MAVSMQFWGVEVKAKEPCKVSLDGASLIHVSQATLGNIKKDNETVMVHVKVGDKKLVLAILSQNTPQMAFDLVFDEDFEISHNWKNGTVHLLGYQNESEPYPDSEIDSSDEEEEDLPIAKENGQLAVIAPAVEPKVADKLPEMNDSSSDDDSSYDEEDDEDDSSDEEDTDDGANDVNTNEDGTSVSEGDDDSDEDNSDSDDSEEETPAKVADGGKKRPNADAKTPPQSKKAKIATPLKTDGKKGGQPTTPVSSKKAGKTPGGDKTPKSGGSEVSCGSCKKSFKSGSALESHNKAKHGAK